MDGHRAPGVKVRVKGNIRVRVSFTAKVISDVPRENDHEYGGRAGQERGATSRVVLPEALFNAWKGCDGTSISVGRNQWLGISG